VPVPHVEQDCGPLPIRVTAPDARNPQCGCRFHDRCPIAIALPRKKGRRCASRARHRAACHFIRAFFRNGRP